MVDKRKFKDVEVSLLGLGTMRLPCETEQKESQTLILIMKRLKSSLT